ncbi:uncharacterized protein BDZ99DRAFT_279854 [Mytilinidion resinicola]|uniref:Uncharacterized protein n=1 Tax=Mytilinidion resinicola TaxID=574789 RepID=A0A6A6YS17_9PEZI|nr:uncharacterized protein BDZ99DRAFT_279854 [Mytilinidion resinicola]KAF2811722.1 hypothetical protein BDZ99DRAFT_279854 [Mytilinidion resinicola]
MSSSAVLKTPGNTSDVYASVDSYPWDDDQEFQAGLSAILGSNSSPEQSIELELRARCFYYSRKYNTNIDFNTYKAYRATNPTSTTGTAAPTTAATVVSEASTAPSTTSAGPEPAAPYPTSFAHIVDLITTGQPIPGIKEIPNTVLEGQGTSASQPRRKKPWEKDTSPPSPPATTLAEPEAPAAPSV